MAFRPDYMIPIFSIMKLRSTSLSRFSTDTAVLLRFFVADFCQIDNASGKLLSDDRLKKKQHCQMRRPCR
jgi:hypothetical protein